MLTLILAILIAAALRSRSLLRTAFDGRHSQTEEEAAISRFDMKPEMTREQTKPVSYTHLDVYKRQAYQILEDNKEKLHETAKVLLEKETITGMEFMAILAPNQLPSAESEKAEEKPEDKPADSSADDVEVK